jgi:predicted Zn-dependent peptidase
VGKKRDSKPVETEHEFVPQRVLRSKTGMTQTHILYGFDIQRLTKKEQVALNLLNEKIGAGANSILFRELRDKKGYAYNVYSDVDFIPNLKMFYIYAGISEENLKDTIAIIDGVIQSCRENTLGLDESGLRLIKQRFLTDTTIALESSSHIVDYILDGEMDYGDPLIYQEFLKMMDEIDMSDIRSVIEKVFSEPITHILSPK